MKDAPKAKAPKAAKPPAPRTLKIFFNLLKDGKTEEATKQIAKLGADVRFDPNGYGERPALVYAADRREGEGCVRVLLDAGADVNATDAYGRTALYEAADAKNVEIVTLLLERGAAVDLADKKGLTAYAKARTPAIRKLLAAHGATVFGPRGGRKLVPEVKENAKNIDAKDAIGLGGDGNMWIAGNGIFRHDPRTKKTTHYTFEESFSVSAIGAGPPGVTYFATNWGLIELREGEFTLFSSEDSELFDNHITDMRCSPDGRPHMLSYESEADHKHISVFDGQTFRALVPGVDFPPELEISSLAFDPAGNLVIGADGAIALRDAAGAWKVLRDFGDSIYKHSSMYDVLIDGDTIWAGTPSGLLEHRGDTNTLYRPDALGGVGVRTLCKQGDTMWFGLHGGIGYLRGGALTTISKEDSESPHTDVQLLVRDPAGTIWIHAGNGIATIRNDTVERFD